MSDNTDERKFLHDLSSPLSAAMFMIDVMIERAQSDEAEMTKDELVKQLNGVLETHTRLKTLIESRRAILKRSMPAIEDKPS